VVKISQSLCKITDIKLTMNVVIFNLLTCALMTSVVVRTQTVSEDGVQEILLPMCKNFLPYNTTKLPNSHGHATQVEVYRYVGMMIQLPVLFWKCISGLKFPCFLFYAF